MGYNAQYKGYRCLYPPTGRVFITRHAIFDEHHFPFQSRYHSSTLAYTSQLLASWQKSLSVVSDQSQSVPRVLPSRSIPSAAPYVDTSTVLSPYASPLSSSDVPSALSKDFHVRTANIDLVPIGDSDLLVQVTDAASATNAHHMATISKIGVSKPNTRYILLTSTSLPEEPKYVASALKHPGWNRAMTEEIQYCLDTNTWDLVPPTLEMNILGCKWVFRVKLLSDGSLDKLKARLVAKENKKEKGVDFIDIFSPVVKTTTICIVLSVAIAKGWPITQLDVKNSTKIFNSLFI